MRKLKFCLFFLSVLLSVGTVSATHVTPEQALSRLEKSGLHRASSKSLNVSKPSLQETVGNLYIFSNKDNFMILPDDDRAPALLAYSNTDNFLLDGNPALEAWVNYYNKQLQFIQNNPDYQYQESSWVNSRSARNNIAPLIKTEWNQESPYNMLCPKVNGHDVVTGCVATAMAQFMKYYNYPAQGKGTHSYYWEPGKETLSLDYDTIPFQWNLMTDKYDAQSTEAAKKAVAELMLACGISVDMHYDIGDSGAATTHMGVSLIDIFDYSPSLWMAHREYYNYDEWIGMIYNELSQGNPVLYSGQGTAGGHQFICDGFEGDGYFHFNWGWGGLSNGYFLLTALNPDDLGVGGGAGGFNTDQIATLSARPPQSGDERTYIMYNSEAFLPDTTTVKAGDDLRCEGIYFNYSMSALPEGATLGMKFTNESTKDAYFVKGPDVAGLRLDEGRYYDIVKFPELPDGTYTITPALNAADKWSEVRMPLGYANCITAVVSNNVAQLTAESDATINIRDIEIPDTIYAAHNFPMKFTAYNDTELEYYGNVTPYILDEAGIKVASSDFRPMDVLPSDTEKVTDYIGNFTALSGMTITPGTYNLIFTDPSGNKISENVPVFVDTTSVTTAIKVSDFKLDTDSPITIPNEVRFTFSVTCDAGVYYSCPRIIIFPGDGGYEKASLSGENIYLVAGQSGEVKITGNLNDLEDGGYMAAVYEDGKNVTDFIHFEIARAKTSVDGVIVNVDSNSSIYNLNGTKCHSPLTPGIYIINGYKVLIK